MVELTLKSKGYAVVAATDGQQGLEVLERDTSEGDAFDLVVLDINMPHLDGLSLLQKIRARPAWANLPVLMLTTEGEEADRDRAFALGATDYMAKPFKPSELLARVATLIKSSQ